jgi:hypothetical protein
MFAIVRLFEWIRERKRVNNIGIHCINVGEGITEHTKAVGFVFKTSLGEKRKFRLQ